MIGMDAQEVSELIREISRERAWFMGTEGRVSVSPSDIETANKQGGIGRVELNPGQRVVGFACIWPERPQYEGFSHVGRLSMGVAKPYRRQGISRRLLETVLAETKFARIELEVFEHNEAAVALYRKFGFETEGVKRKARFLDGKYMNIVLMALLRA